MLFGGRKAVREPPALAVIRQLARFQDYFLLRNGHCERVASLARALAEKVPGGQPELAEQVAWLMDIGYFGIPFEILLRISFETRIPEEEWATFRTHPIISATLAETLGFPAEVVEAVRAHHEAWDGSGYPDGRMTETIPLAARIVAIADAYVALRSDRPHRTAFPPHQAREILSEGAGEKWDPQFVRIALEVFPDSLPEPSFQESDLPKEVVQFHRDRTIRFRKALFLEKVGEYFRTLVQPRAYPKRIVELLRTALPHFDAYLFAVKEDSAWEIRSATGVAEALVGRKIEKLGAMVESLLNESRPCTVVAPPADSDLGSLMQEVGLASGILGPLRFGEEVYGLAGVFLKDDSIRMVQNEDLETFRSLLDHLGPALEAIRSIERSGELTVLDPVTGAYSMAAFSMRFHEEMARAQRYNEKLSLLLVTVENYAQLMERLSDVRMDVLMREIYTSMSGNLRASDVIARYKEDAFLVLLPHTPADALPVVAQRLARLLSKKLPQLVPTMQVLVSFGGSTFPEDGEVLRTLVELAKARRHVYRPEELGGN